MSNLLESIVSDGAEPARDPFFPHAPARWTPQVAVDAASRDGLALGPEHWDAIRSLQLFWARHEGGEAIKLREVHDALEEKFHGVGGLRHLYELFPGGPVAQGCRLAGLEPPAGAVDRGFGSVA